MLSRINSTTKKIWKKMSSKAYRDSFVAAHVSNTVASQISALRSERKWTQGQLAEKSGMRQSRISALEDPNNENFEIKTLLRLASAFDVGLTVRFAAHSAIAEWASTISQASLRVPKFESDSLPRSDEQISVHKGETVSDVGESSSPVLSPVGITQYLRDSLLAAQPNSPYFFAPLVDISDDIATARRRHLQSATVALRKNAQAARNVLPLELYQQSAEAQ
jgi:transcriptional regulator with XRE-family HTH domain